MDVLPEKVLFATVIVPILKIPPPLFALFPEKVLSVTVRVPVPLFRIPPPVVALLSDMLLLLMVSVPLFLIPPPSVPPVTHEVQSPWRTVISFNVTLLPELIIKTRVVAGVHPPGKVTGLQVDA